MTQPDQSVAVTQGDKDAAIGMLEHAFRNVGPRALRTVDFADIASHFALYRHRLAQATDQAAMRERCAMHNGMTSDEQPPIPLHDHRLAIRIATSAHVAMDEAMRQRIADAVWGALPLAEDGDVWVEVA